MHELSTQLTFISDPGHGWLAVPLTDIAILGIEGEISSCSFIKGEFACLEEDGDCARYIDALAERGVPRPEIRGQYVPYFDRNLPRFGDAAFTPEFWDRLRG